MVMMMLMIIMITVFVFVFCLPHITRLQFQKDTKNVGRNGDDA